MKINLLISYQLLWQYFVLYSQLVRVIMDTEMKTCIRKKYITFEYRNERKT